MARRPDTQYVSDWLWNTVSRCEALSLCSCRVFGSFCCCWLLLAANDPLNNLGVVSRSGVFALAAGACQAVHERVC